MRAGGDCACADAGYGVIFLSIRHSGDKALLE